MLQDTYFFGLSSDMTIIKKRGLTRGILCQLWKVFVIQKQQDDSDQPVHYKCLRSNLGISFIFYVKGMMQKYKESFSKECLFFLPPMKVYMEVQSRWRPESGEWISDETQILVTLCKAIRRGPYAVLILTQGTETSRGQYGQASRHLPTTLLCLVVTPHMSEAIRSVPDSTFMCLETTHIVLTSMPHIAILRAVFRSPHATHPSGNNSRKGQRRTARPLCLSI